MQFKFSRLAASFLFVAGLFSGAAVHAADKCSSVAENSSAKLTCPSGQTIFKVVFASYGLAPTGSCGAYRVSSCSASNSLSIVQKACLGKSTCTVGANNGVFGDPCYGSNKALTIDVQCAGTAATPTPAPTPKATPTPKPVTTPTPTPFATPTPTPSGTTTALNSCAGNGTTDDTACVNNVFNSSTANIAFPAGKTYLISSALNVPAGKVITGNSSRILTRSATAILGISGSNVSINGLILDFEGPATQSWVIVEIGGGVQNVSFINNYFTGANAVAGIHSTSPNTSGISILNNTFDTLMWGILFDVGNFGSNASAYQNNITIENNTFSNISQDGVEMNSPVYGMSTGSQIPGVAMSNILVENNTFTNNAEFGVGLAGCLNSVVSGNKISGTGNPAGSANVQGIHIEDYASNITVSNNSITAMAAGQYHDGIFVTGSNKIYIYGNSIDQAGEVAIVFYDNPTGGSIIAGNKITNTPSQGMYIGVSPNVTIGPASGYGGNTTASSGAAGNLSGQGSIWLDSASGDTVTGNSGN